MKFSTGVAYVSRYKASRGGGGISGAPPEPEPPTGAIIWLNADALAVANGQPVSLWPDSISGVDFSAAGADRPTCVHNAINNRKAVQFNAAEFMTHGGNIDWTSVPGVTVCLVFAPNANGTRNLLTFNGGAPWTMFYNNAPDALGMFTGGVIDSDSVFPDGVWSYANFQQPRALDLARFYVGDTLASTPANIGGIDDNTSVNVLGAYAAGASAYDGLLAELLIYPFEMNALQRTQWAAYVAAKYAL